MNDGIDAALLAEAQAIFYEFPRHDDIHAVCAFLCGINMATKLPEEVTRAVASMFFARYPEIKAKFFGGDTGQ